MRYLKANIYYIAPMAIWFVFYGFLLTKPGPFAKLLLVLLVLGVAPYAILWGLAWRFSDKAGPCRIGSVIIFSASVLMAVKCLFFSRNAEEAIGFIFVPVSILILLSYVIVVLPLAAIILFLRRRSKSRLEGRR
jgi:hypothetical protein